MRQFITLNTTYYITKYFLSHPALKLVLALLFAFIMRNTLDISLECTNLALCMEEDRTQELPRPSTRRVSFDPTIVQDESTYYKNKLMRCQQDLGYYKSKIKHLKHTLEEQHNQHLEAHVINSRLYEEVQYLQSENRTLTRELAVAQSKLSRFSRIAAHLEDRGISFSFLKRAKK